MANATTADSRAGYELYRLSSGDITMSDLNDQLTGAGYNPVSERMMRHYRNLFNSGYNRYVSINRFDVAKAARPYDNLGSDGRYLYLGSDMGVRVTFARDRRLVTAVGRAERVGETGALLVFEDRQTVRAWDGKDRPKVTEDVRLDVLDPPRSWDARVLEVEAAPRRVVLEVEFSRLESMSGFVGTDALPTSLVRFTVQPDGVTPLTNVDAVGRQLYALFDLVEASRALVNRAAQLEGDGAYADVPEVESLSLRSPLIAVLGVPDLVAQVAAIAVSSLGVMTAYERWRRSRLTNNSTEIDNEGKQAKADVDRAKANLQVAAIRAVQDNFGLSDAESKSLSSVYDRQVLKALESFVDMDIDRVALDGDVEEPSDEDG